MAALKISNPVRHDGIDEGGSGANDLVALGLLIL
jgi:hypothetical protein